ncbi:MAG: MBL fold metallo-hydrolase [Nitriliruptorales bacterium]|nr:MBL fold metallo-hydrolase [Nitriliruptorales bacterium]
MTARDRFIVGVPLGRWQTNCYVVGDRDAATCAVIDPGETGAREVPRLLDDLGVTCEAILLTHGHLDHFWAAPQLAKDLDVPVFLHPDDRWLWEDPGAGFGSLPPGALQQTFGLEWDNATDVLEDLSDGMEVEFGNTRFRVEHNPGHTPGHVTFLGRDLAEADVSFALGEPTATDEMLFSGDLIFAGSIGRTDFPRGSTEAILRSLADTVLPLQDDTVILSGHGPDTTVGRERATNPFLAEARQRHAV